MLIYILSFLVILVISTVLIIAFVKKKKDDDGYNNIPLDLNTLNVNINGNNTISDEEIIKQINLNNNLDMILNKDVIIQSGELIALDNSKYKGRVKLIFNGLIDLNTYKYSLGLLNNEDNNTVLNRFNTLNKINLKYNEDIRIVDVL